MLSKLKQLYLKYFILCWLPFLLYVPRLLKHRGHHLKESHHCLSLKISSLKYQLYISCI